VSHLNHSVTKRELATLPQIQSAKVEVRAKDTRSIRPVLFLVAVAGLLLLVRLSPVMRRPGIAWAITSDAVGYVRLADGLATGFTWIGVGLALARSADAPLRSAVFIVIPLCSALLLLAAAAPFTDWSDWDRYRVPAMPMLALVAAFGWTGGAARRWDDVRGRRHMRWIYLSIALMLGMLVMLAMPAGFCSAPAPTASLASSTVRPAPR
jgi:hypothetical protein